MKSVYLILTAMALVSAIVCIAGIAKLMLDSTCPGYALSERLAPMTDGDCKAIGLELAEATKNRPCVRITNDWYPIKDKIITRADALAMASHVHPY